MSFGGFAEENKSSPPSYTILITSPAPEETFQNSTQELTVSVSVTPELRSQDYVVILVDGKEAGEPQQGTSRSCRYTTAVVPVVAIS